MKFDTVKLSDICSFTTGKLNSNAAEENGLYPFFTCSPETLKINNYTFDQEAILLAGNNAEGNFNIKFYSGKFNAYQRTYVFTAFEKCNLKYLYYSLKLCLENFKRISQGTATKFLTAKILNSFEIDLPSIEIQHKIANILKSLDDKIELNNKINENLEQQAQAIFKSWFVDFEPFGGVMPKEWCIDTISKICKYSKDKVNIDKLTLDTYYSTENMQPNRQGALQATTLPTIKQTTACKKGDVLISNIRPYFKKILYCFSDCGCSTDVLCFVPISKEYSSYMYCALYSDKFFDYMVAGAKGTKMPRGDKQQIMMYPICIPTMEYIEKFNQVVLPILETVYNNRNETKDLAAIRDTLLPKLMSGEIDVSEVKI